MNARLLMGLVALLALASCGPDAEDVAKAKAATRREDAPTMPKIAGCTVERYLVGIPSGIAPSMESVYVARCQPSQTVTTSMERNCGKNCTQRVTTITTTEGVPEEKQ